MRMKAVSILALAVLAACGDMSTNPTGTQPGDAVRTGGSSTIYWSGYTWNVKHGTSLYPGPNRWSNNNVWVDANGYLHMKITYVNGYWYAAEIGTTQNLGFGTYQFWVEGRIDLLDPNVVLGLFGYAGPDGQNELDIEFSRWGAPNGYNASYTVYPSVAGYTTPPHSFNLSLEGTFTTQRYRWESGRVHFQTLGGHRDDNVNQIHDWDFAPTTNATQKIPQSAMPARINLWLMNGTPPMNGQEVEIVIRRFTYTPL
jgi:hypothetical protein